MWYRILQTEEFKGWFNSQDPKSQVQIEKRLSHIETDGHFGTCKRVGDFVWELKWKNGRRVYYAYLEELDILLLIGGNKNGQSKDIRKAEKIVEKYTAAKA